MAISDTVADLLTRIRNAKDAKHKYVDVQCSSLNKDIVEILKEKGYINNYIVNQNKYKIRIYIKYILKTKESIIKGLKRASKPGLRKYIGYKDIPYVFSGLGIAILTTPAGVLDGEKARALKVGGELLCLVW